MFCKVSVWTDVPQLQPLRSHQSANLWYPVYGFSHSYQNCQPNPLKTQRQDSSSAMSDHFQVGGFLCLTSCYSHSQQNQKHPNTVQTPWFSSQFSLKGNIEVAHDSSLCRRLWRGRLESKCAWEQSRYTKCQRRNPTIHQKSLNGACIVHMYVLMCLVPALGGGRPEYSASVVWGSMDFGVVGVEKESRVFPHVVFKEDTINYGTWKWTLYDSRSLFRSSTRL